MVGRPGPARLLEPMGVHRDHRGHGYGTAITVAAAALLRELGSSSAIVCTASSNVGAVATYGSAGFRQLPDVKDLRRTALTPQATQNSFPSGSCITTAYRCRVAVSIRDGWSIVAPSSTSSATLASTVAMISSIGAERSATKMSKWNRVLTVFFSGTGWNQIPALLRPDP